MATLKEKMEEKRINKWVREIERNMEGRISVGLLPGMTFPDVTPDQMDSIKERMKKVHPTWVVLDWVVYLPKQGLSMVYTINVGLNVSAAWSLFQEAIDATVASTPPAHQMTEQHVANATVIAAFCAQSNGIRLELQEEYGVQLPPIKAYGKVYDN